MWGGPTSKLVAPALLQRLLETPALQSPAAAFGPHRGSMCGDREMSAAPVTSSKSAIYDFRGLFASVCECGNAHAYLLLDTGERQVHHLVMLLLLIGRRGGHLNSDVVCRLKDYLRTLLGSGYNAKPEFIAELLHAFWGGPYREARMEDGAKEPGSVNPGKSFVVPAAAADAAVLANLLPPSLGALPEESYTALVTWSLTAIHNFQHNQECQRLMGSLSTPRGGNADEAAERLWSLLNLESPSWRSNPVGLWVLQLESFFASLRRRLTDDAPEDLLARYLAARETKRTTTVKLDIAAAKANLPVRAAADFAATFEAASLREIERVAERQKTNEEAKVAVADFREHVKVSNLAVALAEAIFKSGYRAAKDPTGGTPKAPSAAMAAKYHMARAVNPLLFTTRGANTLEEAVLLHRDLMEINIGLRSRAAVATTESFLAGVAVALHDAITSRDNAHATSEKLRKKGADIRAASTDYKRALAAVEAEAHTLVDLCAVDKSDGELRMFGSLLAAELRDKTPKGLAASVFDKAPQRLRSGNRLTSRAMPSSSGAFGVPPW